MKAEIEKILDKTIWTTIGIQEDIDKLGRGVRNESIRDATSSLTALIIKWLEEHKREAKYIDSPEAIQFNNEQVYKTDVRNQLITELIGEVR